VRGQRSEVRGRQASFDLDRLRRQIKPLRLYWFPRLRSTNDHAAELRRRGDLFAPAIVLTGHQTAGRGRGTNAWWSRPGVLTVTFVFPIDQGIPAHQLPLLAGLAVRDAIAPLVPSVEVKLKWPNDLLIGTRKLAGLLCERVRKADLVGLGLNVNVSPRQAPSSLRDRVVSLSEGAGHDLDMTDVLIVVAKRLHAMLLHRDEQTYAQILRRYDEHHALIGRRVSISPGAGETPIAGICRGLDTMGRLIVKDRSGGGVKKIVAGEVKLL
jgi:BirA family biotin operon repressor/biotin-[acetyl-CoA-carboxylase] ligase